MLFRYLEGRVRFLINVGVNLFIVLLKENARSFKMPTAELISVKNFALQLLCTQLKEWPSPSNVKKNEIEACLMDLFFFWVSVNESCKMQYW